MIKINDYRVKKFSLDFLGLPPLYEVFYKGIYKYSFTNLREAFKYIIYFQSNDFK